MTKYKLSTLVKDLKTLKLYESALKTESINLKSAYICCVHWSTVDKIGKETPDICCTPDQLVAFEKKLKRTNEKLNMVKTPPSNLRKTFKSLKRKYEVGSNVLHHEKTKRNPPTKRKLIASPSSSSTISKRNFSKRELKAKMKRQEKEIERLTSTIDDNKKQHMKLQAEIKELRLKNKHINIEKAKLQIQNEKYSSKSFKYAQILKRPKLCKYLSGLSVDQFQVLFAVVQPWCHLIIYPDCKGSAQRILDKETELLAFLTICRHALHYGIMGFMLDVSESTVNRIFVGWAVFLDGLFSEMNLKPERGFLLNKMPDIFIKTGHGLTDIIIDCTEFKFTHATNLEINSIMFSNYKNTITGKALRDFCTWIRTIIE